MSKSEAQGNTVRWIKGWVLAGVAVVVLAAGCASTGSTGEERTSRDVLTRAQLESVDNLTAFDAVRRLRPLWLRTERGQDSFDSQSQRGIRIYVDQIFVGGAETLREWDVQQIQEIRFLDRRKATTQFGVNHAEGAILITTRT